jgi:hypothetical protein
MMVSVNEELSVLENVEFECAVDQILAHNKPICMIAGHKLKIPGN